ncbi:unnamed protein product [Brassica napus]|uniref:(rape) hypothetical protein n=1 Tax=Brassica napus TaxID=3708 RepID=A0A816I7P7_BRANA|nr:unnamed protein product [Brassica napus]
MPALRHFFFQFKKLRTWGLHCLHLHNLKQTHKAERFQAVLPACVHASNTTW